MNEQNEINQVMQKRIQEIETELQRIDERLSEMMLLQNNLDDIEKIDDDDKVLANISKGIFIKTRFKKQDKLYVNVGSGTVVEKTIDETKELVNKKVEELESYRQELIMALQNLINPTR